MNKIKKSRVRLSTKAIVALKIVYDTSFKIRANEMEKIKEYSFSILLYWNQIEALIKVLMYRKHITSSYPDKLIFINRRWSILKNLYESNNENYNIIFGEGGQTQGCLWKVRNRITHANHEINEDEFRNLKVSAIWVFNQLFTNMDENYEISHKNYLAYKKKKTEHNNFKKQKKDINLCKK